jgi:GntR family transcriptional regulator
MGYSVKSEVLEFETIAGDAQVSRELQLNDGSKIYKIKRLRYVNSLCFAVETSYIPFNLLNGLTVESVQNLGLYNTIDKLSGIKPDRAVEVFEAIILESPCRELLGVKKNTPGYHIKRVTSCVGTVFEYCETLARSDILRFNVVLDTKPYIMPSPTQ